MFYSLFIIELVFLKRFLTFGDFNAPQTGSVESVQDVVLYTTCVQSCLQ
jgi:hypothetical protein